MFSNSRKWQIQANLGIFVFFSKIRLRHFLKLITGYYDAKNLRNPMIGFRDKLVTDGRTDERTNERRQIYRTNLQSRWVQKSGFVTLNRSQQANFMQNKPNMIGPPILSLEPAPASKSFCLTSVQVSSKYFKHFPRNGPKIIQQVRNPHTAAFIQLHVFCKLTN